MSLLLLLTVLVLVRTTWLALFLSKLVTRPVAALAEATQEISRGRLDYRVDVSAADEIGDLVQSFNRMAEDLEASRRQIEASSRDLSAANTTLEQRRRHIETILESIPTGVLSLDAAAARLPTSIQACSACSIPTGHGDDRPRMHRCAHCRTCFPPEVLEDLEPPAAARRSHGHDHQPNGNALAAHIVECRRSPLPRLQHQGERLGYVLVFEDLSDLLKAQKQAAWREVARRVAHEIKNPLTPIALSAERIRRHLDRGTPPDAASLELSAHCAETIAGAVETVRTPGGRILHPGPLPCVASRSPPSINAHRGKCAHHVRWPARRNRVAQVPGARSAQGDGRSAKRSNAPWPIWSTMLPKPCKDSVVREIRDLHRSGGQPRRR